MVPPQEESGMSFNSQIIDIGYWDIKIKVKQTYTQFVNVATKTWIQGRDMLILLVMNHSTFLDDTN